MLDTLGTRVVIGLAIAAALGLADVVGVLAPAPDVGESPPWLLTLVTGLAGAVTLIAVLVAFLAPGNERLRVAGRPALWVVVAARAVSVLASIMIAFRNGATTPLIAWTAIVVAATVAAVVLILSGAVREPSAG